MTQTGVPKKTGMDWKTLKSLIENLYQKNSPIEKWTEEEKRAVLESVDLLDKGKFKLCHDKAQSKDQKWKIQIWLKQAILLFFKLKKMKKVEAGEMSFFDKIPLKQWKGNEGVRVVPHALVRYGAYVAPGAILMPSYVNIGAYVGEGTMVDTWATVGSCAQVGARVHLSGGVGVGGVLEPLQASPVIIEDDVFLGSRCVVVEGVHVEEGAVLGAGVVLTASTKIVDMRNNKQYKGRIPKNSVVIPGNQKRTYPAGDFFVPCALIIGERSSKTDQKTALTEALREHQAQSCS